MKRNYMIGIGIGVAVLVLAAASASALIARNMTIKENSTVVEASAPVAAPVHHRVAHSGKNNIRWNDPPAQAAVQPQPAQQVASTCNDGNIVGYVAGALAGGLAGSQLGKGNGKIATTIGGTAGGAYLGGQYLPTQNVTCAH